MSKLMTVLYKVVEVLDGEKLRSVKVIAYPLAQKIKMYCLGKIY